jgi:adenylate cyclase
VAEPGQRRKLEAILSADVAGYSRLMQDDDAATVETLTKYRSIFRDFVNRHEGRIVDSPGDNILAEFDSPVEAVQCAVELQRELSRRNLQLADHRQMHFRIGINLGDILSRDDGTIYGDGVNVAARLESLAEPGGIIISESARMQVRTLIDVGIADAGEHEVKNIAEPVHAYRIVLDEAAKRQGSRKVPRAMIAITAAAALVIAIAAGMVFRPGGEPDDPIPAMPAGPTLAVLPFQNMSGDPEQEYFSDGITDNLINDLSKLGNLTVMARHSSFAYKGKSVDIRQIGRELGVRFLLEGSVQRGGDRLRINVQLVDTATGDHIWAERYDRQIQDIFDLQDDITRRIVEELDVELVSGEQARVWRRSTDNVQAYERFMRAQLHFFRFTREDNVLAREYAESALAADPEFIPALVRLGSTYEIAAKFGWSDDPTGSLEQFEVLIKQALALDSSDPDALSMMGVVLLSKFQHDEALVYMNKAVELNPNGAEINFLQGMALIFLGSTEKAVRAIEKAMRLSPVHPAPYDAYLGLASLIMENYDDAISASRQAIDQSPGYIRPRVVLAASYGALGDEESAAEEMAAVIRSNPDFSSEALALMFPFKDRQITARIESHLPMAVRR